jgi:lipopolysaccharide export system permease protein
MKALDRYVAIHVIVGTAFALAIVLAVFTFIAFIDELGGVGRGEYTYAHAARYVLLTTPLRAFTLFPIAAVVGSLLGLGVLAANRELTAARAAGISVARISTAVMKGAVVLLVVAVFVGEVLAPRTETVARDQRAEAMGEQWAAQTSTGFWARDGNSFIHIGEVLPGNRLGKVDIYEFDEGGRLRVATRAQTAVYEDGTWHLTGLRQSEIGDDGVVQRRIERAVWSSGFRPDLVKVVRIDPEGLSAMGLGRYIQYLRTNGLSAARFQLALAKKFVYPIACAVLIYLTLPLVLGRLGAVGVGQRVVVGSLLGIAFHILNEASGHVGLVYGVNPYLSATLPTALFLGFGVWMMRRIN